MQKRFHTFFPLLFMAIFAATFSTVFLSAQVVEFNEILNNPTKENNGQEFI